MSDGAISQDEIDALLAGVDMGGFGSSSIGSSQNTTSIGCRCIGSNVKAEQY